MFIVAHEYSHTILGHLEGGNSEKRFLGQVEVEEIVELDGRIGSARAILDHHT